MTREELERLLANRDYLVTAGKLPIGDAVRAVYQSLPTAHHAELFFAAVLSLGGERVEEDQGLPLANRAILVRDPTRPGFVVAEPLVRFWQGVPSEGDRERARVDIYPAGAKRRPAHLSFGVARARFTIDYDDNGLPKSRGLPIGDWWTFENRPDLPARHDPLDPPPSPILCRGDLDPRGHSVEAFAGMVLGLDPLASPVRVRVMQPTGYGAQGVIGRVLTPLREALFSGEAPTDARWLIADGYEGVARGYGATFEAAVDAFGAALFRTKPKPPMVGPIDPETPPGFSVEAERPVEVSETEDGAKQVSLGNLRVSFRFPPPTAGFPRATPASVPLVAIALPARPPIAERFVRAGFDRWAILLDEFAAPSLAVVRDDADGYTFIGERALEHVELDGLDAALDAAEAADNAQLRAWKPEFAGIEQGARGTHCEVFDKLTRTKIAPRVAAQSFGAAPSPSSFDGWQLRAAVSRVRTR